MRLQSTLTTLLEFDLNQLLAVQSDVTLLISRRVHELLDNCGEIRKEYKAGDYNAHESTENTDHKFDAHEEGSEEYDDDSEAFILTQVDQRTKAKLEANENDDGRTLNLHFPRNDISSPLKESQSLPDSYGGTNVNLKQALIEQLEQDKLPSTNNNNYTKDEEDLQHPKKLCINKPLLPQTNFNINPLTGKAWILEDFRRNENVSYLKKGSIKFQKFTKSSFAKTEKQYLMDKDAEQNDCDNFYEFENLRDRCNSPPGFGRLDFPNTQERFDDKRKSQNLIFLKTKWRFCKATCNTMPPYEREFLFKNNRLNEIVDDGNFEWNDSELQIYMRK